jgi:ABC-type transporter Mla MlaB component
VSSVNYYTAYFNTLTEAHPLHVSEASQSPEFGLLLTGTLTTLGNNADIRLAGAGALLMLGNIETQGTAADVLLQSDAWVYWEGQTEVSGNFEIYAGVRKSGIDLIDVEGANSDGISLLIAPTSQIKTTGENSNIQLVASQLLQVSGEIYAGGHLDSNGLVFTAQDSNLYLRSLHDQVLIDSALGAANRVTVQAGLPDAVERDGVGIRVTALGGITAAGLASISVADGETRPDTLLLTTE